MKKFKFTKIISLLLALIIGVSFITPVFADDEDDNNEEYVNDAVDVDLSNVQIGDQFKDQEGITYTVSDDAANIYVGSGDNQKYYETGDVETFEITYETENGNATTGDTYTWRKYIRLEDLCELTRKDGTSICEIMDETDEDDGEFYLKRVYREQIYESVYDEKDGADMREISLYYYSTHNAGEKKFKSWLVLWDENENKEADEPYKFEKFDNTADEAGKWKNGQMTTDIETLIDENDDVYVSLRFVSESLGAEVRWVSEDDNNDGTDDDAVFIEFYDDKEYCKGIEYTFESDGDEKDPLEVEKSLYMKETRLMDISLDGKYQYRDNDGDVKTSKVDWKKLYVLLTVPDEYPNGFFDTNLPLNERIVWKEDKGFLRVKSYVYGKYSDGQCTVGNQTYDCNLGEDVNITGIIMYKGVPVPIDLFDENNNMDGTCDYEDNYNDSDRYDDDDYNSSDDTTYIIGDTHVKNIKNLYNGDSEVKFTNVTSAKKFESKLNSIVDDLDEDNKYTFVFNMGNDEIYDIIEEYDDEDDIIAELEDLSKEYAKIYSDFYEEIEDNNYNVNIHIITNSPIDNDSNNYVDTFYDYLKDELENENITSSDVDFYELDNIDYEYEDDLEYTEETYEDIMDEIIDYLNLD